MAPHGQKRKGKNKALSLFLAGLRWALSNAFGVAFGVLIFLTLPLLQAIIDAQKKQVTVREAPSLAPPDAPEIDQDEPPPPEPEPEEPPPMENNPEPMSLSALASSLQIGGGGGGPMVLGGALSDAMAGRAAEAFAQGGMDQSPRPVYQVAPKYPTAMMRQGISGRVEMEATVDAQGRVTNARVISSPNLLFNEPALEALQQWRFEPGMRGGTKVPMKVRVPFRFDP